LVFASCMFTRTHRYWLNWLVQSKRVDGPPDSGLVEPGLLDGTTLIPKCRSDGPSR
jgi:hypothetical protein